ncbi:MAG: RloB family protein [Clostridium sp.]|nr:RloB family protein [Clostridium sp.]MCI7444270.1 RloB family protein [Clostridium sp.]
MPPVRSYTDWNKRSSDKLEKIEPFKKYFIICEGRNTETFYFKKLIDIRKQLNIHNNISIILLEKTGEHENLSNPHKLIEFAEEQKNNSDLDFDKEHDKMIIVFDADIFENKVKGYDELIKNGEKNNILAVTNPSFEIFLLLHIKDAVENIIMPNYEQIIKNEKIGNLRPAYLHLKEKTGLNSKKNPKIGDLAENVEYAIKEEKKLNEDIHNCKGKITCNIGKIIQSIKDDNFLY